MHGEWKRASLVLTMATALLGGCTGVIEQAGPSSSDGPPGGPGTNDPQGSGGGGSGSGGASGSNGTPGADAELPAPTPRMARLTHARWARTVSDLLQLEDAGDLVTDLRPDPRQGGFLFDNNSEVLSVDEILWDGYQRAASELARRLIEDASRLDELLPSEGTDQDRASSFVRDFGLRAHRRPLTASQIEQYLALFDQASELYVEHDAMTAGVRLVVEAMLQSPYFLYHVETSSEPQEDLIPLDDYEVASRLSYLLWNTMPDDMLFTAAAAGELTRPDAVAAQARRMLDDPRAEHVVASFHGQLLDVSAFARIDPSPERFPGISSALGRHAMEENRLFVQAIFDQGGGLGDLLTSRASFVNRDLAEVYGLDGEFDSDFQPVTLPETQRSGLLTQIGFLAKNATTTQSDPIHRGVFVAERISCIHIAAPPDDITPPPPPEGRTTRELIEDHTEQPGTSCASCHSSLINPYGFPFEHYEATGAYRTEDNGWPVDSSSAPLIDGSPTPVDSAIDLAQRLAVSEQVHECYARHWVEYAYGRPHAPEDEVLVKRLGERSLSGETSIKELLISLVQTNAFLTRNLQELP